MGELDIKDHYLQEPDHHRNVHQEVAIQRHPVANQLQHPLSEAGVCGPHQLSALGRLSMESDISIKEV